MASKAAAANLEFLPVLLGLTSRPASFTMASQP
jgi:hypothetical protein